MEEKLLATASKLPEPGCDFEKLEELAEKRCGKKRTAGKKRLVILAAVLCLLVTACAYSTTRYGLWGGYSSYSLRDARNAAEKFDYQLPETLNGSPFQTFHTAHGAPEGAGYFRALLSPTYKLYSVSYYAEKQEIREDGGIHIWTENTVHISFGTTEKEPWRYHFSVAEDGSKNYRGVEPGSKATAEYEGLTLHLYTIGDTYSVLWEDTGRKMVIDLSCHDLEKQEDALEIAKELIDLNLPETEETTAPKE